VHTHGGSSADSTRHLEERRPRDKATERETPIKQPSCCCFVLGRIFSKAKADAFFFMMLFKNNNKNPSAELQDFSSEAASFFGNSRIPASIILGSSLSALFVPFKNPAVGAKTRPLERTLTKLYRLLSWSAFCLSLNAVMTCTVAATSLLHSGNYDPLAETAYDMLKREFEYEFVSVRWSITVCLLLFIYIVTLRLVLEFDLLADRTRRDTAKFILFSSLALSLHMVSHVNSTMHCWDSLAEMTLDYARIVFERSFKGFGSDGGGRLKFLNVAPTTCLVVAVFYGIKSAVTGNSDEIDIDADADADKGENVGGSKSSESVTAGAAAATGGTTTTALSSAAQPTPTTIAKSNNHMKHKKKHKKSK